MRRPGYLNGWDEDFEVYMKAKYPGWQSQGYDLKLPRPAGGVYSDPYFPIGPYGSPQLFHPEHGLVPEADVIASRLQISGPSY